MYTVTTLLTLYACVCAVLYNYTRYSSITYDCIFDHCALFLFHSSSHRNCLLHIQPYTWTRGRLFPDCSLSSPIHPLSVFLSSLSHYASSSSSSFPPLSFLPPFTTWTCMHMYTYIHVHNITTKHTSLRESSVGNDLSSHFPILYKVSSLHSDTFTDI